MLPTRDPPQNKKHTQTESEGFKKNIPSKRTGKKKKARLAVLISDKIDFKTKAIKRNTEGHFIILKGRVHQEDINIINIYVPKYIRKFLENFKKDNDSNRRF